MRRPNFPVLLIVLLAFCVSLPLAQAKKKKKAPREVKATTTLAAGEDLRIDYRGDPATCDEWDCYLMLGWSKNWTAYLFDLAADGSWTLYTGACDWKVRDDDGKCPEEGDDDDSADADADADAEETEEEEALYIEGATGKKVRVKSLPDPEKPCDPIVLWTDEDKKDDKDSSGDDDDSAGEVASDEDDKAWMDLPLLTTEHRIRCAKITRPGGDFVRPIETGKLEVSGDKKTLVVPAALLPEGDFDVYTNGFWGAYLADVQIGQRSKTGLVKVKR